MLGPQLGRVHPAPPLDEVVCFVDQQADAPVVGLCQAMEQAAAIDESLQQSVTNTAGLAGLRTTIDHAGVITAGLKRGRERLGG